MHIHTLRRIPLTDRVVCEGCDIALRTATYDEAVWVHESNGYSDDGPIIYNDNGCIAVPTNFSLFQEA